MECTWDAVLLRHGEELPPELLQVIQHGSDAQYLNAITKASLDPRYTYLLFAHCEDLFPHISATLRSHGTLPCAVATLGRVVPFAPVLTPYAERLLAEEYTFSLSKDDSEDLLYLLGLFRLFSFDWRRLKKYIRPTKFASLLENSSRPVIYLAIRILQLYFRGADHWFEEMVKRYLGEDKPDSDIHGSWDDRTIDYRFLTLWEEDRFRRVLKLINDVKSTSDSCLEGQGRILDSDSFDNSIALAGGILLPRTTDGAISPKKSTSSLISTSTVSSNLRRIASAMKSTSPLLIEGISGAGKSLLIRHLAQSLGKLDDMVTLHLNQQSDAKLLMGIYTTGLTPGSFVWKPGVLTTAVQEGRWVLIEDLDRAPDEIIGTILPLIERGELTIPNRQTTIRATSGFRIIATARTTINHRGQHASPVTDMLGIRHWQQVSIQMPPSEELQQVTRHLYPTLSGLLPQLHAVYERLHASWREASVSRQSRVGTARNLSPRDLLKWCDRVSKLLRIKDTMASTDMDDVLLEAMDCFAGALPDGQPRGNIAALIAEELRIDPQRRDYLITQREVGYRLEDSRLRIGRYSLVRASQSRRTKASQSSFSTNPHTNRMLEKVAGAVINREPLLLVGETGVGKTAAVQHLATNLGKKLVPFNLSQQSEAGDLLGGFKPVNARSLFVPLKDEFDDLFAKSFSLSKNQQFLDLLGKQTSRSNWKAVCKLWQQVLKMVDQQRMQTGSRQGEAPSKKRKVESKKAIDFGRWDAFAVKVTDMERRLASGDEAFAFSFVEGNIVKALRNGDWILLDEINLASPDTLEAIADLLDPDWPSLLLTESGSIERIEAHPSFRLFAAMNPATDVGKKDLAPGIRSRFTELYIESPDSDPKSLSSIVQSYLRHELVSDQAVPMDVCKLYQKILELASQNRLVDGAGSSPHFSLRTLTRTLGYAKYIAPFCSLRRALFEGFHMSFLTLLDNESAQLVRPLIEQSLFGKRSNIRAELQRALRKPTEHHVQGYPGSKHWVHSGELPIEEQPHYILTPFIRNNLENLVRATSTRRFPVLIQGPTSSGKTSMIEYLAKRTGHRFVRINNHEHTDLQEYLGTYVSGPDGHLQFQDGILVEALREGHWLVLDELNLAPSDVLEALNRLLDDNRELLIPETQEVVRPHESFMLFATQNPAGLYGGRKVLSRAFRNRFLELHFSDIPIDELQEILHRRTELPESRCKRIVSVYRELSVLRQENRLFEQKSFATLRDLFRWAQRPNDTIEELAANGFMLMGERVRKAEERKLLKDTIERVMSEKTVGTNGFRVKVDEGQLYSSGSREVTHYERNAEDKGVVWTKAIRRLYVLVARALENNEPVLLVGETGCGKTTVCQMLAHALGKKLHCVNAHQNTETGDLIGSQRPIRNRAVIEASLRHQLLSSELLQNLDSATEHSTNTLLDSYDYALASLPQDQKSTYMQSATHAAIQLERTRFKALFEWVDGSLVQAMREGAFFLLDEISLADDSVLERINSVLESQRSILLAEKGSIDSSITAAPGFQFLATMNPGGDYGKRELSPALRNRFTEIWVPPLNDGDDIIQIVHEKSMPEAKNFAHGMVNFAQWFKDRYNTTASSSISIRDALSWATFVNSCSGADVGAAVVHGAAMVYVDTLGANPSGLMATSRLGIDQERTICVDNLAQYLGLDAHAIYFAPPQLRLAGDNFTMGPFSLSKRHAATGASNFSFEAPTTRINTVRVIRALQLPKPIMLEGDPGVGKTALITAVAEVAGISLTRINLSEQTDLMDLFGSDVPLEGAEAGHFAWRDAPFLRAMQNGEWVLLDEMNLASQSVLEGLNACLDHRGEVFVPELGQTFTRHPDFRLFAAQNPHHQGGGRKGLPASFVNRFTVVYADAFRPDDLKLISQQSFPGIDQSTIDKVVAFVNQLSDETSQQKRIGVKGAPWEFNYRDISRLLTLATSEQGLLRAGSARDFTDLLFSQRFRSVPDRAFVDEVSRRCFGDDLYNTSLFSTSSSSHIQLGLAILPKRSIAAQPVGLRPRTSGHGYHLEILQSIMLCVQLNWPVILVGRSGTGKSELLERLAATVGVSMATLTINAETDTMDLIGGFEQTDSTWQMEQAQLALTEQSDVDALTELKVRATLSNQSNRPQRDIEGDQTSADNTTKPKFEWIDGILIDALREGKWLILDNANLCSPSVLDRLNSLLEPNGVLIVNERNNADGSPRIITPHPQFRIFLTMNPRYGELSRAMRNRAVELYFPESPTPDTNKSLDPLFSESAVSRLRQIQTLDHDAADEADIDCVAHTMVDHLTPVDEVLLLRLTAQISTGLYNIPDAVRQSLNKTVQARSQIQVDTVQRSIQLYEAVLSQTQVPADFARVQTFHPLNNQALAQSSQQAVILAPYFGFVYDCSIQLGSMSELLQHARSSSPLAKKIVRLEHSVGLNASSSGLQSNASCIFDSVSIMIQQLSQWLSLLLAQPTGVLVQIKEVMHASIAFGMVFLKSIFQDRFDPATLNTLITLGRGITVSANPLFDNAAPSPLTAMRESFDSILAKTGHDSNFACTALWKALRSATPKNQQQFEALMRLDGLVERFDHVCRLFVLPLDKVVDLRMSFARTMELAARTGYAVAELSSNLETLMSGVVPAAFEPQSEPVPHFRRVFRQLSEHFTTLSLGGHTIPSRERTTIDIFAQLRTKGSQAWSSDENKLLCLAPSVASLDEMGTRDYDYATVQSSLIRHLLSTKQVTLSQLGLLEAEIQNLGDIYSAQAHLVGEDPCISLDSCLRTIIDEVLGALVRQQESYELRQAAGELKDRLETNEAMRSRGQTAASPTSALPNDKLAPATLVWSLQHGITYLQTVWSDERTHLKEGANAWASFACTCLRLYVPRAAFDPVLDAQLKRSIYMWRYNDLITRLEALQSLRKSLTGESDSLRTRLLREDIAALGSEPDAEHIYRPKVSQLPEIQLDLDGLMRTLEPLWNTKGHSAPVLPLDFNLTLNVTRVRQRLTTQYRAYEDFTAPIVGFIDCLLFAQRLALQARFQEESPVEGFALAKVIPFVDASLDSWTNDQAFINANLYLGSARDVMCWLATLALRSASSPDSTYSPVILEAISQRFDQFHQRWKSELHEERRTEAEKSSLYRYKYQDNESDEATHDELEGLFPTESLGQVDMTLEKSSTRARDEAFDVAHLYQRIFAPQTANANDVGIEQLLLQWASTTTRQQPDTNEEQLTPTAILLLRNVQCNLSSPKHQARAYNMYTDQNIGQTKKLLELIHSISQRFRQLQTSWPEHSTPVEVLRLCEDILQVPHTVPLAGLLPRLEKLYAAVNDWQSIASREFAVNHLLADVSEIIISWRRLELSTWAGMFNREWEQCQRTAASWWYVAYDTIMAIAHHAAEVSDEVLKQTRDLLDVLTDFVQSSGLGEYAARLQMLRGFESHLAAKTAKSAGQEHIRAALANFNRFYGHFEDAVAAQLSEDRAKLEKQVTDVIQLASWKDRNIDVLRQSALSSHKKLLRLVRKFRNLLGQPVLPILSDGLRGHFRELGHEVLVGPTSTHKGTAATVQNDRVLELWHERPPRFRDPNQTSAMMASKFRRLQHGLDAPANLKTFREELQQQVLELQKSTPSTSTEENEALVRHLKTRKRRLLADVLKSVRKMGYKSTVSEHALQQQGSTSAVLAQLPNLVHGKCLAGTASVEYEMHRFLGIMPSVRDGARKPSDELTSAEVTRCQGLLESMLQVCVTNNQFLAQHLDQYVALEESLRILKEMAMIDGRDITSNRIEDSAILHTRTTAEYLQRPIGVAISLLQAQAVLSSRDYSGIISLLNDASDTLQSLLKGYKSLPSLPEGIQSGQHATFIAQTQALNGEVRANIEVFTASSPETGPILHQLLRWTSGHPAVDSGFLANGHLTSDLEVWVQELFAVLDTMLASVQGVEKPLAQYRTTTNSSWVTDQLELLNATFGSIQMQETARRMSRLMSQLQYLCIPEPTTLVDVVAILRTLHPIVETYQQSIASLLRLYCALCAQACNTGHFLSTSFISIARRGFCKPSDKTEEDAGQSGDVEPGTGLGDGEGAEDISKDVGDEEDLSELAQDAKREPNVADMEQEKDAVDMADEELGGTADGAQEPSDMDEEGSGGSDQEDEAPEEEAGDGSLDSTAVDEKMWDEGVEGNEAQREADPGRGTTKNEEMTAADGTDGENDGDMAADETEAVNGDQDELPKKEENIDPHVDEGSNLDLPDDMDRDGTRSDDGEDSDLTSLSDHLADAADDRSDLPEDIDSIRDGASIGETSDQKQEDEDDEAVQGVEEGMDTQDETELEHPELQLQQDHGPEEEGSGANFGDEGTDSKVGDAAEKPRTGQDLNEAVEDTADQGELRSENGQSRGANSKQEDGTSQKLDNSGDSEPRLPFKQLGDVLDQWYNKHRDIADAHERNEKTETHPDSTDMEGVEFEHLLDAMAKADAQAIGAASAEESVTLNKDNEIDNDGGASGTPQSNINLDDVQEDSHDRYSEGDHMQVDSNDVLVETAKPTSFVGDERQVDDRHGTSGSPAENSQSDDVEDMDERLMNAHISLDEGPIGVSFEDALKLWAKHEESTRSLALILTEHLRLILQPTQATKMRGDFRTGKRLNIKRIIPYIASSYKRDKIWMRRSTPTKRSYQIMLAIDDSKSMAESESYDLAFETLALIAKSMSMLEVGELSVVGFGEDLQVAHDFSTPFTSEAGARTVQHFTFSQTKTNVKHLLVESIALFRAARLRATGSATDLWQLQLIISDGICDDHPSIRQLVREAHEERIMIVFIVVDFATQTGSGAASSKQSIVDMPTASFVQDEAGNTQLKMVKYLDTFPFKYYLIVQNIQELPNVLAGALRQWFAEVVDSKI